MPSNYSSSQIFSQGAYSVDSATLKSLRLACGQFAYLPKVMEALFHCIRLVASPEHVHLTGTIDLSMIKPYVKTIVMEPTKYSWTMTEEIFGDIVLIAPLQDFCDRDREKIWARRDAGEDISGATYLGRAQFAKLGMRGFVQEYMNGEMPFSDADINASFERYMQHAQRTRDAYETGQVRRAWVKVLTELPDVHDFKIGYWDYSCTTKKPWRELGCEIEGHQHSYDRGHGESVCRRLQVPVGQALFTAAIASLAAARSKIANLNVECVVDDYFAWADSGELDHLDLSRLKNLSFQPIEVEDHETDSKATIIARNSIAVTALLRKCSNTLQNLDFRSYTSSCPMPWPPPSTPGSLDLPPLPALTSFRTNLSLQLSAFSHFLHRAPALSHLQLDGCGGELGEWRHLWDAIRDHPNRMALEFDQLPCIDWTELSVYHHTGEPSKIAFVDDPYDNIDYSLENYLSGRRHWDRSLRLWFDNNDEPSEEEDDENDYSDDSDGAGDMSDNNEGNKDD